MFDTSNYGLIVQTGVVMTYQLASQYLKELLALEREAEALKKRVGQREWERANKALEDMIEEKLDSLNKYR